MDKDCRRLEMGQQAAQAFFFVRAVEEEDRRGVVLDFSLRRQATVAAREGAGADWPARRAADLIAAVAKRWRFVPRLLRLTDPGRGLTTPVVAAALVLGLTTNALGPDRQIHVLALPLAGLLAWNLAVLLAMAARRAWPIGGGAWRGSGDRWVRLVHLGCRRWAQRLPADDAFEPELVRKSLTAYLASWIPAVKPLSSARIRRLLHLGSLAVLGGAVGGMYVRGLLFAYRATWESTFASPAAVETVLRLVLGPASWLTGLEIPDAEPIRSAAGAPAGGDAAPWIHLWAVTAALFAGIPRAFLAAGESLRVRRLSRKLAVEVPAAYLERLAASASTESHRIDVLPYSYRLPAALSESLRAGLLDVFGARSDVRMRAPVGYGSDPEDLESSAAGPTVVVFNLAQTPELEVHGSFLSALAARRGGGGELYVVLDGSLYGERARSGEGGERQAKDRRRAWDRVVSAAGLGAVHLDLRRDAPDKVVDSLVARRDANAH